MNWLPSQEFTYKRTYSRWIDELLRREELPETADRTINFYASELGDVIAPLHRNQARKAFVNMDVMPSMRAAWAAGPAAKRNHVTMYNCSYLVIKDIRAFSEVLFLLMCGTGVGFSIEAQYTYQLPDLRPATGTTVEITVEDSKEGWADALSDALQALWQGHRIAVDYKKIRPKGSRLITMGGRASGPEPLADLMNFAQAMFDRKRGRTRGRKLEPIDVLDLCCKIAEIVVVGGVRRSSEITLSDVEDWKVAIAKKGQFWIVDPHRRMSNNSAVFDGKPSSPIFLREWTNLAESGTGERGIFNAEAAVKQMMASGRRIFWEDIGTNPCGEILLRPFEFCNLSEPVVRANDTLETLREKVRIGTMIGTWQSAFTDFPYIREEWKRNCEEERLLGVSLTGIMDHPVLNNVNDKAKKWLSDLKHVAIKTNDTWARKLGINPSAAITCVKPSGTVSQLVNSASGIHPRYAQYYIRRYRISATDPLFTMLQDQGVPWHKEIGEPAFSTAVLEFPVAAPKGCKTRHDYSAIQQLEHWKMLREFWCEHNPSCTVYVNDDEWVRAGAWVYDNFDEICGVSFLPKDNGIYQLAPYEEINKTKYDELLKAFPEIDYSKLSDYEREDNTVGAQTAACSGDKCEI